MSESDKTCRNLGIDAIMREQVSPKRYCNRVLVSEDAFMLSRIPKEDLLHSLKRELTQNLSNFLLNEKPELIGEFNPHFPGQAGYEITAYVFSEKELDEILLAVYNAGLNRSIGRMMNNDGRKTD